MSCNITPVDDTEPLQEMTEFASETDTKETLIDQALIESLSGTVPTTYVIEMETSNPHSTTASIKPLVMDGYIKCTAYDPLMRDTSVLIYNGAEKTMYQYTEGDSVGMKETNIDSFAEYMNGEEAKDFSLLTYL